MRGTWHYRSSGSKTRGSQRRLAVLKGAAPVALVAASIGLGSCKRDVTPTEACVEASSAICERQAMCAELSDSADHCKEVARDACLAGFSCTPGRSFHAGKVDGCIEQIRHAACTDIGDPLSLPSCAAVCTDADEPLGGGAGAAGSGGRSGSWTSPTNCEVLQEGFNAGFMVDGFERQLFLHLPHDVAGAGPLPVVFSWHGLGQPAADMDAVISPHVNNSGFPFIAVTPEDTDYSELGLTLDWDVFRVDPAQNREARLFDEVLACLQKSYAVDQAHIHSVGFSMGAIATDMLGTIRGSRLASIATFSGGYFSDAANVAALGILSSRVMWPPPLHGNAYPQIIIHGGATDAFDIMSLTVHFDEFAENDTDHLNGLHHDVVLCDHGQGHTAPLADLDVAQIVEFFKDHPRGTVDSPYSAALPADYPRYCTFSAKR